MAWRAQRATQRTHRGCSGGAACVGRRSGQRAARGTTLSRSASGEAARINPSRRPPLPPQPQRARTVPAWHARRAQRRTLGSTACVVSACAVPTAAEPRAAALWWLGSAPRSAAGAGACIAPASAGCAAGARAAARGAVAVARRGALVGTNSVLGGSTPQHGTGSERTRCACASSARQQPASGWRPRRHNAQSQKCGTVAYASRDVPQHRIE